MTEPIVPPAGHAVIAGFGLPGRAVGERLADRGIPFVVIERNPDTVRRCLRSGQRIILGDATSEQTLREAGIESAILFAATMPDDHVAIEAVAQVRRLNSSIKIIARCEYLSNGMKATKRGADEVVVAEQAVAAEFDRLVGVILPAGEPSAEPVETIK